MKKMFNEKNVSLAHKIVVDVLFAFLFLFFLLIIAESLLPGFVSSKVSLLQMVVFISLLLIGHFLIERNSPTKIHDHPEKNIFQKNKKTAAAFAVAGIAVIINSILKFSGWEMLVITAASVFALIYFYKIYSEEIPR